MALLQPDVPQSLGSHLDELRRRLTWPVILCVVCFFVAFLFQNQLKLLFVAPLQHAIEIVNRTDPTTSARAGLTFPEGQPERLLKTFDLTESMMTSMSLSFWAALAITIPFLLHQLYQFIAVGLNSRERHLAFLFVPVAVICFYAGACFGYYLGMPWFFAWFITWTSNDPIGTFDLRLASYRDTFFFYTICFGLMFDVPWAVVVVVRVGLVRLATLAKGRRIAFMITTILAALIAPGDMFSMLAVMFPLYGLFELGLFCAWLVGGPRPAVEDNTHA